MSGDFRFIAYEQREHVVSVTIRRPEVMNALNMDAHGELDQAWSRFESDDSAWVAILTGEGQKAFCAGADLKEARQQASPQQY